MSRLGPNPRVLCVARWPVGGIRTYFRYIFERTEFRAFDITVAVPSKIDVSTMRADLAKLDVQVVEVGQGTASFFAGITKLILSRNYDLVHSHGFTSAVSAALASRIAGVPHLVTQHDVVLQDQYQSIRGRIARAAISTMLSISDAVQPVSKAAADNLIEAFPAVSRATSVRIIPNGIEVDKFLAAKDLKRSELGVDQEAFLIGFFGRFMGQKGFRYLVDAIESLASDPELAKRIVVVAVGGGGFRERERRDIERRGLGRNFRFIDFVPEIGGLLKTVDMVAMPSLWEACGLVGMEALVSGVPLVVTDCPALMDIAKGSAATVVERANAEAIAAAIDRETRCSSFERAKEYAPIAARRFDVGNSASQLSKLYCELLQKRYVLD